MCRGGERVGGRTDTFFIEMESLREDGNWFFFFLEVMNRIELNPMVD